MRPPSSLALHAPPEAALFVPPLPWGFALGGAGLWELCGRAMARRFAGPGMRSRPVR